MRQAADADPETAHLYRTLGRQIAEAREKRKLSQAQLAEKCGLTRGSVANIELGRQHAPLHTIWKIGAALALEPRFLVPTRDALGYETPLPEAPEAPAPADQRAARMIARSGPALRTFVSHVRAETSSHDRSTHQPTQHRASSRESSEKDRREGSSRRR